MEHKNQQSQSPSSYEQNQINRSLLSIEKAKNGSIIGRTQRFTWKIPGWEKTTEGEGGYFTISNNEAITEFLYLFLGLCNSSILSFRLPLSVRLPDFSLLMSRSSIYRMFRRMLVGWIHLIDYWLSFLRWEAIQDGYNRRRNLLHQLSSTISFDVTARSYLSINSFQVERGRRLPQAAWLHNSEDAVAVPKVPSMFSLIFWAHVPSFL